MPTALGNHEKTLPPGVVCRPCNNGPLSVLDQHLCNFAPVALMRVYLDLPGRDGKPPVARCGNAHVIRQENDGILIDCKNGKPAMRPKAGVPNQHTLTLEGRRMTARYTRDLVRSLYKITLGLVYLDQGRHVAMGERFDSARQMILGQSAFSGYLGMVRESVPHPEAHFTYQFVEITGEPTVTIHADLYGVQMLTDLDFRRVVDRSRVPLDRFALMEF